MIAFVCFTKNAFALFLTIYSTVTVATTSDSAMLLGKGLKYYQEGQYDQAKNTFQSLLEVHPDNAALLFNLGLTQYHLGHYGLAIGLWRKALHQNPYLIEANQAIHFTEKHIQAPQQQMQILWMERLRNWILVYISLDLCLFLTVVFGFFFLWFKIKYLILRNAALKKANHPPVVPTSLIALGSIWVFILLITALKTKDYLTLRATIIAHKVTAKVGPSDQTASLFKLAEGQDVIIKQTQNDWVQVQYLGGQTGWVQQKDIFHYAGERLW